MWYNHLTVGYPIAGRDTVAIKSNVRTYCVVNFVNLQQLLVTFFVTVNLDREFVYVQYTYNAI